jgi:surface polysaccharide O-acyltransferase-like enzyme
MATPLSQKSFLPLSPRSTNNMSKFLPYIHNLRGLAILFIVGVHVRGYEWHWEHEDKAYDFFVALFDNGTVLFVFIAGFLFQHLTHRQYNFGKYLQQKAKFVMLPYLIVSVPIIIFRLVNGASELPLGEHFDDHSAFYKIVYYLVTGMHMAPFWFMPMIFLIYLTSPLLHALDKPWFYQFIFPFIFLIGMFTYRPINNANPLLSYIHFLPIYLTGMWTSYNKEKILNLGRNMIVPLIVGYIAITALELGGIITLTKRLSFEQMWMEGLMVFNVYVFKAVILCFLLLFLFYRMGDRKINWLHMLGEYSFGIYFIHYYFISAFRQVVEGMEYDFKLSTLTFIAFYLGVIFASILCVHMIKKVSGKSSRYIIGS